VSHHPANVAAQTDPDAHHPLVVQRLTARYGARTVLQDISFVVPKKQICAVLGASGCGKSTLLKHAVGLLAPTSGTVELLGQPVHQIPLAQRAQLMGHIGLLFQGGALMHSLPVIDNVALPLMAAGTVPKDVAYDIAHLKLQMVHMDHAAFTMPNTLSGGMKKRVALARAMVQDPSILFCDEPSAGLDPVMAAELDDLILGVREQLGTTVVVVTHELASILAIADRVLMLHEGTLIADGTVAQMQQHEHPAIRRFFARAKRPKAAQTANLWDTLGAHRKRPP
jgi:phospholipid/cholesterol/gamma-HCH transport system ATP-binding protein